LVYNSKNKKQKRKYYLNNFNGSRIVDKFAPF
jgi:hypothetical protein